MVSDRKSFPCPSIVSVANVVTGFRLLLSLPFAVCMAGSDWRYAGWAGVILAAAIVSDLVDGVIARRMGTASATGRLFDHCADVVFVVSGLGAGTLRGAFPWALPVLVAAAFAQYAIDSYVVDRAGALRASRLGRYNGILYFVPLGGDVLVRMGASVLRPAVIAVAWILIVSTVVSMGERLVGAVTRPR